jgi:hypothetical protein
LFNTFLVFIISGFWHGANWTYIFWGGLHAAFFAPLLILKTNRKHTGPVVAHDRKLPGLKESGQIILTFCLVTFAWIFFRSSTITDAFKYIKRLPHRIFTSPGYLYLLPYAVLFIIADWLQRRDERLVLNIANKRLRYVVYFLLAMLVVLHFQFIKKSEFIYFKF